MSKLKRLLWVALAYFGMPGDFHWWATVVWPLLGAAVMDGVLAFVREAPLWQLILVFFVFYVSLALLFTRLRKWWSGQQAVVTPNALTNIGHQDNRSVTSYNQTGGQTAEQITNIGVQGRTEAEELRHRCLQVGTELSKRVDQWLAEYHKVEARKPTTELQRTLKGQDIEVVLERARNEYEREFRKVAMKLFEQAESTDSTTRNGSGRPRTLASACGGCKWWQTA